MPSRCVLGNLRVVPLLPFITTLLSLVFGLVVLMRYGRSRRMSLLMWGIGFLMFSLAALSGGLARANVGDAATEYRLFYAFGAIANVAWLALGTVFLLWPRYAIASLAIVIVLTLFSLVSVFVTPVDVRVALDSGRGFPDGSLPRILAAIGSGVGSLVLIGGALWSAWVFMRRRQNGRRALANVVIAVGVLIVAAGGTVTFTGANGILETTNLVGLCVMLAGFLLA